MKKIMCLSSLILGMLVSQIASANLPPPNYCNLGQKCQLPINSAGEIGFAQFHFPAPSDNTNIGTFTCTFSSSDPSVSVMTVGITASFNGAGSNFPVIVNGPGFNTIDLPVNQPITFSGGWTQPGQPHPGIEYIILTNSQLTTKVSPSAQLFYTCNKQ